MSSDPISLNLARIVHRLITRRRGWRVDELQQELGIQPRTYRKYRKLLFEEFAAFDDGNGDTLIEEIVDGDFRYLRLRLDASAIDGTDLPSQIAAVHFARHMLSFLQRTDIGRAASDLTDDLESHLRDRHVAHHMLRNLDRLLYLVPDAPKDYTTKGLILRKLVSALFLAQKIKITYDAANSTRYTRELEPLSLVSWRSGLYLLASMPDEPSVKTYAVDRILAVDRLHALFNYPSPSQFHPRRFTEGSFGIFHDGAGAPLQVELVFADIKWLKVYLQERQWHSTQQFNLLPDGRLRMTFVVNSMAEVWPWIRSFGIDVEVVQPTGQAPRGFSEQ